MIGFKSVVHKEVIRLLGVQVGLWLLEVLHLRPAALKMPAALTGRQSLEPVSLQPLLEA